MEHRTLVLTHWYFPYQIIRWQDAVRLIYLNSATVVSEYNEEIRSPSVIWKTPAVIRLFPSVEPKRKVRYSRFNVFVRDGFQCQYCGTKKRVKDLTIDHLVPRANGGKTCFENTVAACGPCNLKKGCRTSDESGMFPRVMPVRPKTLPLVSPVRSIERTPPEWVPFVKPYLPAYA